MLVSTALQMLIEPELPFGFVKKVMLIVLKAFTELLCSWKFLFLTEKLNSGWHDGLLTNGSLLV